MSTSTVTLIPSGEQQAFPLGTVLSDALLDMGMALRTPCGGKGTCGKCRVVVGNEPGEVLACRTPLTRDLSVHACHEHLDEGACLPSIPHDSSISLAVDIGTTTVKLSLVDTSRNTVYEISSFLNPQRRFGHDVISRIAAARDEMRRLELQALIRRSIDLRIRHALQAMGIAGERVEKIVLSGNTTMLYLFHGIETAPLGRSPYTAGTRDFPEPRAPEVGISSTGTALVHTLPVLGAFTGADLVAGLALSHDMGFVKNTFFIDLGTNGELFVLDGMGRAHAASCAMGPALEGMNIAWGMTADIGAITRVFPSEDRLEYRMIGSGEPAGITGTALVDLIAILLGMGVISTGGAFSSDHCNRPLPAPMEIERDGESKELALWGRIRLSQKDVRNLQLAKGASRAASGLLLEAAGCRPGDIEHVLIAGAFGGHLDLGNFSRLGFLPDFRNARVELAGNTSLKGAAQACLDPDFYVLASALRDKAFEFTLSNMPEFQDLFIRSLDFPA